MRRVDIINKAIEQYRNIGWEVSKNVSNEKNLLSSLRNELEWENLSASEKQQKRKGLLKSMHKMESDTPAEELKKIFALEICVIEFYDLLQNVLDMLALMDMDRVSVIRLHAMLFVEKVLLNETIDAKKIQHQNFNLLIDIFDEYSNDTTFEAINFQELKMKLIEKENLLNESLKK